jgi:IclR family acetate operon transcriptional repressor
VGRVVTSVARAVDVLEALAEAPEGLTLAALSRSLGVPKSTLHAILGTLARRGMAELLPDGARYRLGPKLTELGFASGGQRRFIETAHPFLVQLVSETGESAFLGVPAADPLETVYVTKVESPHVIRYSAELGERRPSHATAAGKALLSTLPDGRLEELLWGRPLPRFTPRTVTDPQALLRELRRVRSRGYAVTVDERVPGASGVAAVVRSAPGRVAALSLIGPTDRMQARLAHHIPLLLRTVREIEQALGQGGGGPGPAPKAGSPPEGAPARRERTLRARGR